MRCVYCGGALRFYSFQLKESAEKAQRAPCLQCGSNHALLKGSVEAINPRPMPLGVGNVLMPWRESTTRPLDAGKYECRFTNEILMLDWDGAHFRWRGDRVQMRTFVAWRGTWA